MTNRAAPIGQEFTVSAVHEGDSGVLTLSGYISGPAEESVMAAYADINLKGIRSLRIRFREGFIITSAGIAVLITIAAQEKKKKRPVIVEGLTPHYKKIFEMIGLSDYVKIDM